MKFKSTFLAVAAALPLVSNVTFAQTFSSADMKERVFGSIFGEYYMPDIDKTESPEWDYMEKDWGYGVELGYYLNEYWALRAEYARLEMESALDGSDVSGNRLGIDVMYHLPHMPSVYLVGGLKRFDAAQDTTAANIGVGYKHFFNQSVSLYAEANRYQGIDESYGDAGIKLGLTFAFGAPAERAEPAPAPAPEPVRPAPEPRPAPVTDSDNDGVPDNRDNCANTDRNHQVDAQGCTVYVEKMAAVGDIDITILFPFDSAAIPGNQRADVVGLGNFMQRFPESTVVIEGHASKPGNDEYNLVLSKRRARAVADMLKSDFNIDESRITAIGYGETRPRVEGDTREAHRANQRIEAKVTAKVKEAVKR